MTTGVKAASLVTAAKKQIRRSKSKKLLLKASKVVPLNLKQSRELLTPKKATEYLSLNTYEGQRKLKTERVSLIVQWMRDGTFRSAEIGLAHYKGKTILVNGQHQCSAIIETGLSVQSNLYNHYCSNAHDLAATFAAYDSPDNVRSVKDVIRAHRVAANVDCSDTVATTCAAALAWCSHGEFFQGKLRRDERAQLLFGEEKTIKFVNEVFFSCKNNLKKIPIVAAAIKCFRVSQADAIKFWVGVRDGEMLKKTDPQYKVMKHCERDGCCSGRPNARETHAKCIHGWNAYRSGASTALKYYSSKPLPEVI